MTNLALYYGPTCPFCIKVIDHIEANNLVVELRNKESHPEYGKELIAATGKGMVPCLRITSDSEDTWLHESSDIVAYLKGNH
ncbi:MAG: glutaredoxin [Planctomycetota bacterium]|jgi:glutaredoxin